MAHGVQHPELPAGVAVVLRGLKGAGKGTLGGHILQRIFRHHSVQIRSQKHLVGNFNAHLLDALYLFVDEAFWAGDKQGVGVLNALITEPTVTIEGKGVNAYEAPNRLKLVFAANLDWMVPATADERRYFAPTVSEKRCGDLAYFDRLYAAIDGDELPALLHHLLAMDLTGFNIRAAPHTRALGVQKLIGADSVGKFWHDCLSVGAIVGIGQDEWPDTIVTQLLNAAYLDHAKAHGERHPKVINYLMEDLRKLCVGCAFTLKRLTKPWVDPMTGREKARPNGYALDSLEKHRAAFLKAMKIDPADHDWPDGGDLP